MKAVRRDIRPIVLLLIALVSAVQGCTTLSVRHPKPPYSAQQISHILDCLTEQMQKVNSSYSLGRITIKTNETESDANILIIATRDPLYVKIEITNYWGRPVAHILIHDEKYELLAFYEKKHYLGTLGEGLPREVMSGLLDNEQVWSIVRGYPVIREYERALSFKENQLTFLNGNGEIVQVVEFDRKSFIPLRISFPDERVRLSFSGYLNEDTIQYARKMVVESLKNNAVLSLNMKKISLNKPIPHSVFELNTPPDFTTISTLRSVP